jgi:hypothetical protein
VFRFLNIWSTFLFTSPAAYNVGSNKWRICYATSTHLVLEDLYYMTQFSVVVWLFSCWVFLVHILPFLCRWGTFFHKLRREGMVSVIFEGLSATALFISDLRRAWLLLDQ